MNAMIVTPHRPTVKPNTRFVPPVSERETGAALYRAGKPLRECVTDDMAEGWLDAELSGALAYSRHMEAEGIPFDVAFSFVNWNSGAEVW